MNRAASEEKNKMHPASYACKFYNNDHFIKIFTKITAYTFTAVTMP